MHGCESWTKRRISSKELMLWNSGAGEETPLDSKEFKPVNPKGNQSWIFIGRTDAEAEASTLWSPHAKNWLIRKDPDAGKDWRQEEKGMTEEEMVEWHHWLDGYEFEQTPGDSEGREAWHSAVHGVSESETIEQLNNNWKDLPWGTRLVILGSVLWGQDHQGANLPSKGESSGNSKNTVHWEFWSILASSSPKPLLSFHTLPESSGIGTHLMGANTFPSI